jgi:hypothetical protein
MPRNRVIPPSEALFISSNATGVQTGQITQLHRVQSANYGGSTSRQPVTQYGLQAPIDQVILEPNDVSLDFSYLVTNALNESRMGFVVDNSAQAVSGFLTKATDEHNYYILSAPEGNDAVGGDGTAGSNRVWGIGNGFISSYQFEAAVGSFPTANVSVQALNLVTYSNSTGQATPAIHPVSGTRITNTIFSLPSSVSGLVGQSTALKPGDVFLNLTSPLYGVDISDAKIQNARVSVDLSREALNKLGSHFPFSRELQYPINVSISVDALIGDLTTGSLSDIICNDAAYELTVGIRQPSCNNNGATAIQYTVRGAKLDSQSISSSVGSNKSVSLQWTAQIGGPTDTIRGLFISGILT